MNGPDGPRGPRDRPPFHVLTGERAECVAASALLEVLLRTDAAAGIAGHEPVVEVIG